MKKFMSVILAVVLVTAVSVSFVNGTVAGFFDHEVSTENWMCAGTRILQLDGGPITIDYGWPCSWYTEEFTLINAGTLEGMATIHIPLEDDPCGKWDGLVCIEDAPDEGVATSESELVAEEGGCAGEDVDGNPVFVPGLGIDKCNLSDYVDIKIYFENDLIVEGKLSDIACTVYDLGLIPPASSYTYGRRGGGWGSYFTYHIGDPDDGDTSRQIPLIAGKKYGAGTATVWNDEENLYIKFDTGSTGWKLYETHVFVGLTEPPTLAPGQWQKTPPSPPHQDNLSGVTEYTYEIPLPADICTTIYMAAHAVVCKGPCPEYPDECGCWCETAWAKGEPRKLRIEMHFPDIDEDDLELYYFDDTIPAEAKWDHWPTNAYMGDKCIFDMVFDFKKDCTNTWWKWKR